MTPDSPSEGDAEEPREVETEQYVTREEVVDHLESFVDGFRGGETVTMTIGDETVEFEPPEHLEFEVEYEEYGDERELEFELEWRVQNDDLDIE